MPHDSYFQGNPTRLDVSRSKFRRSPRWWGSWNTGKLFPIFATSSVMPGDTFRMSVSSAIRMVRPAFPVMDDMDITVEAYFVPHRLVLSRKSMSPDLNDSSHSWTAFIGAQDSLLNMPTPGDIKLPRLLVSDQSYAVGGLGDCLNYHKPDVSNMSYAVNPLKVLAYYSIWNEYFREPNTQSPVTYSITTSSGNEYVTLFGGDAGIQSPTGTNSASILPLAPVSRYHGYFGSALPWPQRNSTQVEMPLGDAAPVITGDDFIAVGDSIPSGKALHLLSSVVSGSSFHAAASPELYPVISGDSSGKQIAHFGTPIGDVSFTRSGAGVIPTNLYADLSQATAASVNQFRLAVQTQRWYEALARSGNKYSDLVHGMFGVRGISIPDRPEYLGGFTAPINMSQVNDTASNLGQTGAFSLSNPGGYLFTKSFTEHGTIMVVACCRVKDSFSQGIAREDTRFDRFDFYWPQFANLGEQPILKKELFINGNTDNDVFGYQEAWAEYRMFHDNVTGYMNPNTQNSVAGYTYTNVFASAPTLKGYLNAENEVSNVDRTLTADHTAVGFQFFGNFEFQIDMVRPMPTYSIPGLVDHH